MAKTLAEKIAVMQACDKPGAIVERKCTVGRSEWEKVPASEVLWDWIHYDYRVPQERETEMWTCRREDGTLSDVMFRKQPPTVQGVGGAKTVTGWIKVRVTVIEE